MATFLYLACYVPELYANYKNKNANIYNIPEKVIMLAASCFGLAYAISTDNMPLVINYGPFLAFDVAALWMRVYYANVSLPLRLEIQTDECYDADSDSKTDSTDIQNSPV
jgi:hypothetical protein